MGNCCRKCEPMSPVVKTNCAARDFPLSFALCMENVPLIGHMIAAGYSCTNQRSRAERAGLKATVGILLGILNVPAEFFDEIGRKRSSKLLSVELTMRPDWMKHFKLKTIREICLPGSHQSGTCSTNRKLREIPMVEGWPRCQGLSIDKQLLGGIRFLDLRVLSDDQGDMWLHHNVITCVELSQALQNVKSFISQHPSEIVGIYITNDGQKLDWQKCHQMIIRYLGPHLINESLRNVPIGELVKKKLNVFIVGVPNVAYSWGQFTNRWPNMQWPLQIASDMSSILEKMDGNTPYSMYWYKAEATPNAAMVVRSVGGLPGVCAESCAEEKFEFLEDLASAVNYQINNILQENVAHLPFNVISTDFVNDLIIGRIIELNGDVNAPVTLATEPSLTEEKVDGDVTLEDLKVDVDLEELRESNV